MDKKPRYIDLNRIIMNQQTLYDYFDYKWVHIPDIPTEDVAPICYCKDCIYANRYVSSYNGEEYLSCQNDLGLYRDVPEDGFCYQGSRE
jgi:hypothetical protein